MGINTELNARALRRMFNDSYNNLCALENLSVNPQSYNSVVVGDKTKYIYSARANRYGKVVKLPVPISRQYLKFSLGLNIFGKEDKQDKRTKQLVLTFLPLIKRSAMHRLSVEVFVDHLKVPDSEVYITVYDGSTDLYVPGKWFERNGSVMDVVVRDYSKEPYMNRTLTTMELNNSNTPITLYLTDIDLSNNNLILDILAMDKLTRDLTINDYRIYKGGKLIQQTQLDYTNDIPKVIYQGNYRMQLVDLFTKGTQFYLQLEEELKPGETIEVCVEPETNYRKDILSKQDNIITFPKDIPGLDQFMPISLGICDIYMEGQRLFERDVDIVSPRVFKIKDSIYRANGRLSIFINYNGIGVPQLDYKEDSVRYLHTIDDETIKQLYVKGKLPDSQLSWLKPEDEKFKQYPPVKDIYNDRNYVSKASYNQYLDNSIKGYIEENAHNIIPLLSQYVVDNDVIIECDEEYNTTHTREDTKQEIGSMTVTDMVTFEPGKDSNEQGKTDIVDVTVNTFGGFTFTKPMVLFTANRHFPQATDEDVLVFVNGIKIPKQNVTIAKQRNTIYIYIDKELLPSDEAYEVMLKHVPIYNIRCMSYPFYVDDDMFSRHYMIFNPDILGSIQDISDILLYKFEDGGWKLVNKDYNIAILDKSMGNDLEGMLKVDIKTNLHLYDKYLLMNTSFFSYGKYDIEGDDTQYLQIDKYDNDLKTMLPTATNYSYLVYEDGVLLIDGIDYFITSQLSHPNLTEGRIMFINRPKINSVIEVYFIEQPHISYDMCQILDIPTKETKDTTNTNDQRFYDAIYIRNCDTGFSTEYIDLYINDVLIPSEYITEIELNLLLIKELPEGLVSRPFKEAYIKTRFDRSLTSSMQYIEHYHQNESRFKLYIDHLYSTNKFDKLCQIIYAFATDDHGIHTFDEKNQDESNSIISPITDLIARDLLSGELPRRIDANILDLKWARMPKYVQAMTKSDIGNPTFEINCNYNNISVNADINSDATMKSLTEITEIVSKAIKDGIFPMLRNGKVLDANIGTFYNRHPYYIQKDIDKLNKVKSDLDTKADDIQDNIDELTQMNAANTAKIEEIRQEIATIKAKAPSSIGILTANSREYDVQIIELNRQINELTKQIEMNNEELNRLDEQLENINNEINKYKEETDYDAKIAELTEELNKARAGLAQSVAFEKSYYGYSDNEEQYGLPDYSINPISAELYLEELHLGQPDYDMIMIDDKDNHFETISDNRIIDANEGDDYAYREEDRTITVPYSKLKRTVIQKDTGQTTVDNKPIKSSVFVNSLDLSKYSISSGTIPKLKINLVEVNIGGNDAKIEGKMLNIYREMNSNSTITLEYKTRIYNVE